MTRTILVPVGTVYGRLTVTGEAFSTKGRLALPVLCQCGTARVVDKHNLARGNTNSCGCLHVEMFEAANRIYPKGSEASYSVWCSMVKRCTNVKNKNYGGRGITISESWKDFLVFYADMGNPPTKHQIDRTNNSLGYSAENCRWVSQHDNLMNRRNTVRVEYLGEQKTLCELSDLCGVSRINLYNRLFKQHFSVEEAMFRPVKKRTRTTQQTPAQLESSIA